MLRFFKVENSVIRNLEAEPDAQREAIKAADWIDAQSPDEAERLLLDSVVAEDLPQADDMDEIEATARFFVVGSEVHIHSLFLVQADGRHHTSSVACIMQPNRLLTVRDEELADFRLLRMRARRGQVECRDTSELLLTLMDQKVENLADTIEDLHHTLERASHTVLEEVDSELDQAIDMLAALEDSSGKIRLCLMDTQRAITFLQRHLRGQETAQEFCREILRDIDTLMAHTTFLFEKINFLMDSTQGFINIRQNQTIKTFSIAAVVFLPPTLIASIYGMNFNAMPELDWPFGYPVALAAMLASAIAPYLFFKYKGWL